MTQLKDKLREEMKVAMKARESEKLQTIRSLLSAIQYEEMQKEVEALSDEQEMALLKTELKKRRESLEFAEKDQRAELVTSLQKEIQLIESFLPKQLSSDELERVIVSLKEETPGANVGAIMKALKDRYSGQYDGKTASEIAKKVLG